jgi:multiple sugar transport system permease protein
MPRSTFAAPRRSGALAAGPGSTLPGRRRISPAYVFLAPGLAVFTLVMLIPTVQAFTISLTEWSVAPGRPSEFVGAQNYLTALGDPVFWTALQNSGIYVLATVLPQMFLGLVLAVALDGPLRGRAGFRALIYIPVISSWVVVSLLFRYLFGTDGGAVNAVLGQHVDWFGGRGTAMFVIVLLGLWKGVGWAMLIFLAALQAVPGELREAAAVDGAGSLRRFWVVTIPAIRRTMTFVAILLIIGGFNVFISVKLMTDGGPSDLTQVPLTYLYRQAFNFLDFGYGSAIAFILTVLVFALSVTQLRLTRRDPEESAA